MTKLVTLRQAVLFACFAITCAKREPSTMAQDNSEAQSVVEKPSLWLGGSGAAGSDGSLPRSYARAGVSTDSAGSWGDVDLFAEFAKRGGTRVANVLVVTPGKQEELSVSRALKFLKSKGVDTGRFTHARVSHSEHFWEVTLLELPKRPQFGGFEYWINVRVSDLSVSDWGQAQ
jgi:hypothetical protein